MMHHILDHDAARHKPLRIQIHPLDITVQYRSLGLGRATSNLHRQRILLIYGIKMKRWYINQHILLMSGRTVSLPPPASLHVHKNLHSLISVKTFRLQFFLQRIIERRLWLNILQECRQSAFLSFFAINIHPTSQLLKSKMKKSITGMLHLHIKKATVSHSPLDGIVWIGGNAVQTIQDE